MDKTFLIRWYGSFYGENALDDLKEWEIIIRTIHVIYT